MTVTLQNILKSRNLIPPALFFLKIDLAIEGFLCFQINFKIIYSSFVKNAIGNLIRITLNLQIALVNIIILTIFKLKKKKSQRIHRKSEQTFLQRRHKDGQKTHEKILNSTNDQIHANQNYQEVPPYTSQNGYHQNNKCWRGCELKRTLLYCQQE